MKEKNLFCRKVCAISLVIVMCINIFQLNNSAEAELTEGKCLWKTESEMPTAKYGWKNIVELNGKIYMLGGIKGPELNANDLIDNKVDIYNTKTKEWTTGKDIPKALACSNCAIVGNKIYLMGGETCAPSYTKYTDVYVYDIINDTWDTVKPMPKAFCCSNTAVIGDKIYVIDGYDSSGVTRSIQIYNTTNNTWSLQDIPSTVSKQSLAQCHVYKGKIYMIGGEYWTTQSNTINKLTIYDPEKKTWTTGKELPDSLSLSASVLRNDKIYVMGGINCAAGKESTCSDKTYIYDIENNEWSEGPTLSCKRFGSMATLIDDKIYLFGGVDPEANKVMNKVEVLELSPQKQESDKIHILLYENEKQKFSVSYDLEDNQVYKWTSSDNSIVTVNEKGMATAVSEGEAEVTVVSEDGSYTETIAVKVVSMRKLAAHIQKGQTVRLYLTEDATSVSWKSENEDIATVDESGLVTGKNKGLVAITAELNGKTYELYVRVSDQ